MQDVQRDAQFCVFVNISEALKAYCVTVQIHIVNGQQQRECSVLWLSGCPVHSWSSAFRACILGQCARFSGLMVFFMKKREGNDMRRERSVTATHFISFDKEANVALC